MVQNDLRAIPYVGQVGELAASQIGEDDEICRFYLRELIQFYAGYVILNVFSVQCF